MDYEFVPGRDDFPPDEIAMLRQQLADVEESNKAVEKALDDVDYRGTYADGVLYLKRQLAAALAACELQHEALIDTVAHLSAATSAYEKFVGRHGTRGRSDALFSTRYADFISAEKRGREALAIQPDASALKAHDEALIERCAKVCDKRTKTVSNGNGVSYRSHDPASVAAEYCADAIRELKHTPT